MGKYDDVKQEIEALIKLGTQLSKETYDNSKNNQVSKFLIDNYEGWYTKSLYIVRQLAPERENDFIACYKFDKRKMLNEDTYVISDILRGVGVVGWYVKIAFLIKNQVNILSSCYQKFDSKVFDLETLLQADVFDSEIESARHLLKKGFLRAAGAICGVIIEKHLAKVCKNRGIAITKKDPSIGDYNDRLKDIAYDIVEWRRMQHLGDIRNLCDHEKNREPTKEEVEELVNGTDRVIKSIF
ncbi:MAG: hypothetical protein J1F69_01585 [Clostridiales bacterium]|nr:hypothetical protein [Clostridiales bacterium]